METLLPERSWFRLLVTQARKETETETARERERDRYRYMYIYKDLYIYVHTYMCMYTDRRAPTKTWIHLCSVSCIRNVMSTQVHIQA